MALILGLAAFLILFRLGQADIQTDDGTYSFRALGYLDFMDSDRQTSPVDWFEAIPSWSKLSFHDAPPLVFLIQHVFFKLFGTSVVVARLPFALAGIGSVLLLYFIGKRLYNVETGLLASFLLAISTYHTWASRVGYLEPIALFFILLTLLWFLKGLENEKHFIGFGLIAGLMLLTKYTTVFLFPAIFCYLLFTRRKIFINKYFIISLGIALALFSPVLIYNAKMLETRRHFDLQFATLLHQDIAKDWPNFGGDSAYQLSQLGSTIIDSVSYQSPPLNLLLAVGLVYFVSIFCWRVSKKKSNRQHLLLALMLGLLILELSFIGSSARFLVLITPFYTLIVALLLLDLYRYFVTLKQRLMPIRLLGLVVGVLLVGVEIFYNLNTNHFRQPIGPKGVYYSALRWPSQNLYNQLESYLISQGGLADSPIPPIRSKTELKFVLSQDGVGQNAFIYDPNLRWFSNLWYFRRWAIYHHNFFGSADDIARVIGKVDWINFFKKKVGASSMYFIWGRSPAVFDPGSSDAASQQAAKRFADLFAAESQSSIDIKDSNGDIVFTVYKISLNQ